ncbi:MAG TPA: lysophospholipid acyltransferase family protein [Humisphaera sp.]|jgi:1-acyl-sn-glycerol-3-phosphate acyltransferase|nr:lysophospholipid acyltransferase family protein [Humisphaera sp.]
MRTERTLSWKWLQILGRVLATALFDFKVYGRENIPARGGVLIVSNHQSYLDPILMALRLDRPLNYIAKSELFENRYFGRFLRHVLNAFPVRQGAGDIGAIRETIRRLQEGHLLNMYPEGARTWDGKIAPLQKGAAMVIRRAKVPVIPAVIVGAYEAWPIFRPIFRPWPVRIRFGPPMDLTNLDDEQIIAAIDQTLRSMFESECAKARGQNHCARCSRGRLASRVNHNGMLRRAFSEAINSHQPL